MAESTGEASASEVSAAKAPTHAAAEVTTTHRTAEVSAAHASARMTDSAATARNGVGGDGRTSQCRGNNEDRNYGSSPTLRDRPYSPPPVTTQPDE